MALAQGFAEGREMERLRINHGAHGAHEGLGLRHAELTEQIIGAAIEVHRVLGAGMLESAYEACLCHELFVRGLAVERQVAMPLRYKDVVLDVGYRLDLVVEGIVAVELKSVAQLDRVHDSQLLSYLRLSGLPVGLLINF